MLTKDRNTEALRFRSLATAIENLSHEETLQKSKKTSICEALAVEFEVYVCELWSFLKALTTERFDRFVFK